MTILFKPYLQIRIEIYGKNLNNERNNNDKNKRTKRIPEM